jgi:putative peptide zinc metalloprotease protein
MTTLRRALVALSFATLGVLALASPASAQAQFGEDDNHAVAINTEDGASVFRIAFSVRWVTDGVVDQTNAAVALASCVDCQTVALAFQVVFVQGSANTVTPENLALAYNEQCVACVTYASATQVVLGVDGPVRLTGEGWRRLADFHRSLRELEDAAPTLTVSQLNAQVQAAKQELLSILATEVVPIGPPPEEADETTTTSAPTTSTTDADGDATSTTTTTVETETTTSTTAAEETTTSTTSTTAAPSTTIAP